MKLIRVLITSLFAITTVSCQVKRPDNVPEGATYNNKGGAAWEYCEQLDNTLHNFPLYQCTGYNEDGSIYNSGAFVELVQQNLSSDHILNQVLTYDNWWKGKRLSLVYKFREDRSVVIKNGVTVKDELRGYRLWFMSDLCLRGIKSKNFQDLKIIELTDNNLLEVIKWAPSLFHDKMEEQISNIPKHADVKIKERSCWVILEFRV